MSTIIRLVFAGWSALGGRTAYFKRGFSYLEGLLSTLVYDTLVQCFQDSPNKTAEFSGDSGNGNMTMFALVETPELFVEPVLGLESNGNNGWRLRSEERRVGKECRL